MLSIEKEWGKKKAQAGKPALFFVYYYQIF
jgi:hypothetical protein